MLGTRTPLLSLGARLNLRLEPRIHSATNLFSSRYTSESHKSSGFPEKSFKLFTIKSVNHINPRSRNLHTSLTNYKKYKKSRLEQFKSKFVSAEDLNKRPSDLEIAKKGLPANQPTLQGRIERDRRHMFHQMDPKHGYWTK